MRYRTRLYIDLNLLAENVDKLRALCPNNKILFMVKGDAYGHGMTQVVRFANTKLGINEFGCATLGEARRLREELSDLQFEIYVFSDTNLEFQSCTDYYLNRRIVPVISNFDDLDFFLSESDFANFPLCLKFNTGMNRLGIEFSDLDKVIERLKSHQRNSIHHLFTHFGQSSDEIVEGSAVWNQYREFKEIKAKFAVSGISVERSSASNSGAIEQSFGLEETHIRPGLMLYGPTALNPEVRHKSQWTGKVISRLETYVINSFAVEQGEPVGYGGTPCPNRGTMALIAIGYGDGFSGRMRFPTLTHKGREGRIFGRVNMDMTQVYFENIEHFDMDPQEHFVIWGHEQEDILRFSDQTGAIPYEVFCHLTPRVPRVYSLE